MSSSISARPRTTGSRWPSELQGSRRRNSRTPSAAKHTAHASGSWAFQARTYATRSSSSVTA